MKFFTDWTSYDEYITNPRMSVCLSVRLSPDKTNFNSKSYEPVFSNTEYSDRSYSSPLCNVSIFFEFLNILRFIVKTNLEGVGLSRGMSMGGGVVAWADYRKT